MTKPITFDERCFVDEAEIIHRFKEGMSKDSLIKLIQRRNAVGRREAALFVEAVLYEHLWRNQNE